MMRNNYRLSFLLLICSVLMFSQPASASTFDEQFYSSNDVLFYDPRSGGLCSVGDETTLFIGNDNREKTWNFLRSKGLTAEQAAGAVGNIDVESGGTFDPEIVQGGGRNSDPSGISSGWGIMQWTPGSKVTGLLKNANISSPPNELTSQLNLVWWHLTDTTPIGLKNFYDSTYKSITNVDEATESFMLKMEAPGVPHLDARKKSANKAIEEYGTNNITASSSATDTCSDQLTAGGAIKGDDYAECSNYTDIYSNICNGQCVSFVWFRLLKYKIVTRVYPGHGRAVVGVLGDLGFKTSSTPSAGSVFSTSKTSQPIYGHTGIVSEVKSDGSIVIEETNYNNDQAYGTRTMTKSEYTAAGYTFAHVGLK